ncbi:glycosyltransferase family 4 protein [Candidatus Omnitrophota bacterium]
MNVCLISREYPPETGWGGIGTYTYQLAHGLAAQGHLVHVLAQSLDQDKDYFDGQVHLHRIAHQTVFPYKGRFSEFALRLEYSQRVYQRLKELIVQYKIDVVEAPNLSAEGFIYSLFKKVPLVVRLHTPYSEVIEFSKWPRTLDRRLSCWLEDAVILKSDLITCSTVAHAGLIFRQLGLDLNGNVKKIPLGVPLPEIKRDIQLNHKKKGPTVLFVGRLEKRKGVHLLVQAIPVILDQIPEASFQIIGRDTFLTADVISFTGNQNQSFQTKLINNLPEKYRDRVHFLGYVEDNKLAEYYSCCDLFVAPSLYESFGFIYIEAMAHGKPVIGSKVGGVSEVVIDQETGILVPPKDVVSLAESIISLLKDRPRKEKMGQAARRHVEMNFTRDLMAERTLKVYRKVLDDQAKK